MAVTLSRDLRKMSLVALTSGTDKSLGQRAAQRIAEGHELWSGCP